MLGAIIGDIVGSRWEFNPTNDYNFEWRSDKNGFTDDTICTVAVADALLHGHDFGKSIHDWCNRYPHPMGGYGGRFAQWVRSNHPTPYNSYGNGSAMRVSPVAHWYETLNEVLDAAKATALPSHNHPEGIKGAQTVSLAIYRALELERKHIVAAMHVKEIVDECARYAGYDIDIPKERVLNKFDETCQGTVPVALMIINNARNFEDAVRQAVALGADADTLGAIVGSIAEAIWGIPISTQREIEAYLPQEMLNVVNEFYNKAKNLAHPRNITAFADKYIQFFTEEFGRTRESYYRFFDNEEFPNDCRNLGFEMDCGHSFGETYGHDAWNSSEALSKMIDKVNDVNVIGNGLFSQWRYFNHWSSPSHADGESKEWFLMLFRRLKSLSESR